jgi:pimeloyl-ACP methyl ester carboxylesterase
MDGHRHSVAGADGVRIGLLTEGSGPALLLVHGAMGSIERWEPVWLALTAGRRVTAMDRRGRRSSGDSELYTLTSEYGDVMAVASALASEQGAPVDVLGHSFGGTCVLGAAALGAPFRRIVLYEPPGPQTASPQWLEQLSAWIAAGEVGRATFRFLTDIIGLTAGQVEELGRAPGGRDVLPIVAATLLREGRAVGGSDPAAPARLIRQPVLLLLGMLSPPWAAEITGDLAARLEAAAVTELPGVGHEAIDSAPHMVVGEILRFLARAERQ